MKFQVVEKTDWHISPIAQFGTKEDAELFVNAKKCDLPKHCKNMFTFEIREVK